MAPLVSDVPRAVNGDVDERQYGLEMLHRLCPQAQSRNCAALSGFFASTIRRNPLDNRSRTGRHFTNSLSSSTRFWAIVSGAFSTRRICASLPQQNARKSPSERKLPLRPPCASCFLQTLLLALLETVLMALPQGGSCFLFFRTAHGSDNAIHGQCQRLPTQGTLPK
jgi:hypothetical protein